MSSTYAFLWFVFLSCFGPHLTLNLPLLVLFFFDVVFLFLGFFCYKETRKANFLHFYRVWVFCSPNTPFFKCFFLLPALVFLVNFLCFFSSLSNFHLLSSLFSLHQSSFLHSFFVSIFLSSFASCFPNHFPEAKKAPTHNSNSGVCPEMPRK